MFASSSKWQLDAGEVSDPSDWLGGSFAFLKDLDASLRCEICSDIIRAPVSIKKCNHTFCSRCIRDYINQPSAPGAPTERPCPNCRQPKVYDSELIPVPQLEVAAEAWRKARPDLIKKAEEASLTRSPSRSPVREDGGKKRKLDGHPQSIYSRDMSPPSRPPRPQRATRSTTGTTNGHATSPARARLGSAIDEAINISSEDSGDEWREGQEERSSPKKRQVGGSGQGKEKSLKDVQASDIVDCPMCGYDFTVAALNRHLDSPNACQGPDKPPPSEKDRGLTAISGTKASGSGLGGWFSKGEKPGSRSASSSATPVNGSKPAPEPTKLKRPQYHLLSEQKLRKLCEESSLATNGSRQVLESRHRRWVDLFNANLDASLAYRRTEGALRREVKEWDRDREREESRSKTSTHASSSSSSSSTAAARTNGKPGVGASEEERKAWRIKNADQFRDLVAQGRKTHEQNRQLHAVLSSSQEELQKRRDEDAGGKEMPIDGAGSVEAVQQEQNTEIANDGPAAAPVDGSESIVE